MRVHKKQDVVLNYEYPTLDISLLRNILFVLRDNFGAGVAKYSINPEATYNHTDVEVIDHVVKIRVLRSTMATLQNKAYTIQAQILIDDSAFEDGYRVFSDTAAAFVVVDKNHPTDTEHHINIPSVNLELEVRNIIDRIYGGEVPGGNALFAFEIKEDGDLYLVYSNISDIPALEINVNGDLIYNI